MRAALNEVELSATALDRSASPTSSETKVCRAGASNARHAAEQEGEHVHVPQLHDPRDGEHAQHQRQHAHRRLRRHQQLALIEVVGRRSRPGQQQHLRPELQRHDDADGRRVVMRQLREHEPVLRDALHPGADVGNDRAGCPEAIVEISE